MLSVNPWSPVGEPRTSVSLDHAAQAALAVSSLCEDLSLQMDEDATFEPGTRVAVGPSPEELKLLMPTNVDAAATTNTNDLQVGGSLGLNLTGAGYSVGVWEASEGGNTAIRSTHNELTGRVTIVDSSAGYSNHATHVAGTIAASGQYGPAKGMAVGVSLSSYSADNYLAEMDAAASSIVASNHSYGYDNGWIYTGTYDLWAADRSLYSEDPDFGKYTQDAADLDDVLFDNPDLLSVWSAGNEADDAFTNALGNNTYVTYFSQNPGGLNWQGAGYYLVSNSGNTSAPAADGNGGTDYDCLSPHQTAKNSLVVGAVNDAPTTTIADFSSRGATDDGRIKPDVVGNGVELLSSLGTANNAYGIGSGTSMSAPNVTGTSVLLVEHFNNEFGLATGSAVASARMKGLLIHTASDLGNVGPDYTYGWGLVDAAAAADFITEAASATPESHIFEETYFGGQWQQELTWNGVDPIDATIVWTDPAAAANVGGLDAAAAALVNDLDLWISGPNGTIYYPWTLNPSNPTSAAVQNAANHRDNVEQVHIGSPGVAGTYTIHVGSTGGIVNGSQAFSILVGGATIDADVSVDAGVLAGDASDDTFEVSIAGDEYIKTLINGDEDLAVWTSLAQCETFTVNGSTDDDTMTLEDLSTHFAGVVTLNSGGGVDTAYVYDSVGDDTAVSNPRYLTVDWGADSANNVYVNDFRYILCHGDNGGVDTGYFHDSSGDDTLTASGGASASLGYTKLTGANFYCMATGFESTHGYAVNGGADLAKFYSGAGDDTFTATPEHGLADYALGSHARAEGFDNVYFYGDSDESETAFLEGSLSGDTVIATPDWTRVNPGTGAASQLRVFAVRNVSVDTKAGTDQASIYASYNGDATLTMSPGETNVESSEQSLHIQNVEAVAATAFEVGNELIVHDSSANDEVIVDVAGDTVTMDYNHDGDAVVELTAIGFAEVTAQATEGGEDRAELYDSTGDDVFTAYPKFSTLVGTGFSNRVEGFAVEMHADNGGDDTAYVHDSADPIINDGMSVTPYTGGIVGVAVELDLPDGAVIDATDFQFQVYNGSTWVAGPAPKEVIVRLEEGGDGKDQVLFTWAYGAIRNKWLEVTVLAAGDAGVANDEVLYFGSQVADINGDRYVDGSDATILAGYWQATGVGLTGGDINLSGIVDGSDATILAGYWGDSLPNLQLNGSQVVDGHLFHGFAGNDSVTVTANSLSMDYGSNASADVLLGGIVGFQSVEVYSQAGQDVIHLNDSAASDLFAVSASQCSMTYGSGSLGSVTAHLFDDVFADFASGGNDLCMITGSTGSDVLSTTSNSLSVDFDPVLSALDLVLTNLGLGDVVNANGNGGTDTNNSGATNFALLLTDWS